MQATSASEPRFFASVTLLQSSLVRSVAFASAQVLRPNEGMFSWVMSTFNPFRRGFVCSVIHTPMGSNCV